MPVFRKDRMTMSAMKREAVHAAIRSQLMNDPKNGTLLLLNIMKLFADKKMMLNLLKNLQILQVI